MNYPTYDKSIARLQAEAVQIERDLGWSGPGVDPGTFGDRMALLHSEVSEAVEAYRRWGLDDATGEPTQDRPLPKPEGVASEFADVLIRLLTECERFGVDLATETVRKMNYNRTRPHRHGGKLL
jgi:NTP pyrophosphatase (non-canonical NTP hydrolase)